MNEWTGKWRFVLGAVLLMAALTGLGSRLAFLHLITPASVCREIDENRRMEKQILAGRGTIYDCGGEANILAMNLPVKDVCANPLKIIRSNELVEATSTLAEILDMPADEVAVRLNRPTREFAWVKRFVPEEVSDRVRDRNIPGVFFRDATVRYYPHGSFMCHVLGFVNHEGVGSAGVEQSSDKYLRGCPGLVEGRVDALRREMVWKRDRYVPALEGSHVVLNLDQNIQHFVEKSLDEVTAEYRARGACAIVQRVKTGEILAMASRPCFDLNEFTTTDEIHKLNRAVGLVYEPGSVFKAVVFSAAFNEHTVSPNMVIDCENGAWTYNHRVLRDYHPYDRLTVADGIKKSSNILAAKTALTVGNQRFYKYLKAFQIGERLGVDLPGEEAGILHPVSEWSNISATRIAIGQGVAVTALQMLSVYTAIANDGILMRPYVTSRVLTRDGSVLYKPQPEIIGRPIKAETAALLKRLLVRVTEEGGTGRRAAVEGYEIAGKTGSAQKPVPGGYSATAHVASFVGFLPAGNPEVAIIVVVDEPQPIHTGGIVAAPVFGKIAGLTVRYLDIPPARPLSEKQSIASLDR